ncbi:MAG: TIGR03085 family metal-binding protein [Flaviflexus sp.]|nr:TIGR03085 family metal-binding protein [Flaviflexus sp.]
MTMTQIERRRLIDRLAQLGPEAPTLCEGWRAQDLLAHLIRREIIPHAVIGSWMPSRIGEAASKMLSDLDEASWEEMLEMFASGRPSFSPLRIGAIDSVVNTLEYVIHTEDLNRAQTPPIIEAYSDEEQRHVFSRLGTMAQLIFARSPVTVRLNAGTFGTKEMLISKRNDSAVTILGEPVELALWSFGRDEAADVSFEGSEDDIEAMKASRMKI